MTQLQFILKFILAGLLTLIWWEITLIQWVTAFVMTRKSSFVKISLLCKVSMQACAFLRSVGGKVWPVVPLESLNQNEM